MVEHHARLDGIFGSLSDPTRRDILRRVAREELSVGQIAMPYDLTLAAVSKHLKILEKSRLITKRRQGKQQFIRVAPAALRDAAAFLQAYQKLCEGGLTRSKNT